MIDVTSLIPHRPPFLYIDKIIDVTASQLVAERTFPADEPFYRGHYPGSPVTPGVLLCEAVFQAAACLIASQHLENNETQQGKVPVITRIQSAKFRKIVLPGQLLILTVELKEKLSGAFFLKGRVSCEGKTAVTVEFSCTLADPPTV